MTRYDGERLPLRAGDVEPGHRLVHQDAPNGWLEVEEVGRRAGGEVVLHFNSGDEEPYGAGDTLWRVAS